MVVTNAKFKALLKKGLRRKAAALSKKSPQGDQDLLAAYSEANNHPPVVCTFSFKKK